MSTSRSQPREQPALHKPPTPPTSAEADKFQIFERWLRVNGAQFPLLELRKYDCPKKEKTGNDPLDGGNDGGGGDDDSDNEAEEKKDAATDRGGSMEGGVGNMSLEGGGGSKQQDPAKEGDDDDDGSKEMRGVHARTAIPPQTVVVSIPKSCLITVEMGQATPIGRKILASDLELDAPKHIFLMIYLLWDRRVHGAKSFFAPYYDILPESLRNMPIFWNEEELSLLRGSHLLVQIGDRAEAIREDYESIRSIAPEFAAVATLEEFQWARMIVCSRNFGLLVGGHRTSALVPHADMLNHYRPRETKWTFCEETQCFTITTLQTIGRGAQVYDSYGQKCNHRFLLNYGFCVETNVEVDGFCPNEVPLELGLDLAECPSSSSGGNRGGDSNDRRECWEKKMAFWSRGDHSSAAHLHQQLNFYNEQQQQQGSATSAGGTGSVVGSSLQALAAAVAGASARGTSNSTTPTLSSSTEITSNDALLSEAMMASSSQFLLPRPAMCPIKRVRVCVSNNENTRILFSMLRVLACNTSELDRITMGGRLSGAGGASVTAGSTSVVAQRLFGLPSTSLTSTSPNANASSSLRTCRDIRYPINLRNERRTVELLLEIASRALSKYPTSLAQDMAELSLDDHGSNTNDDGNAVKYPKYSNVRNAKLQVRGEKEVLHHFALWARTAMHVIDIILHELDVERRVVSGGGSNEGKSSSRNINNNATNGELGYDYVIQAMEEDEDCHSTILRYCSDVLGAVRRDEINRIIAAGSVLS